MLPGGISGIAGIEFLARGALVNTTNAERKEALAVGPDEPGFQFLLLNLKRRREGGGIFRDGNVSADSEPKSEELNRRSDNL
jgi:hypothetical protein